MRTRIGIILKHPRVILLDPIDAHIPTHTSTYRLGPRTYQLLLSKRPTTAQQPIRYQVVRQQSDKLHQHQNCKVCRRRR